MSSACFRTNSCLLPISVVTRIFQLLGKPDPLAEPSYCPHYSRQSFNHLQKEISVIRTKAQEDWRPAARAAFKLFLAELVEPGDDRIVAPVAYSERGNRVSIHVICSVVQSSSAIFGHAREFNLAGSRVQPVTCLECHAQLLVGDRVDGDRRLLTFQEKFF